MIEERLKKLFGQNANGKILLLFYNDQDAIFNITGLTSEIVMNHLTVKKEGDKEILWNKSIEKAIGRKTAYIVKEYFQNKLK